MSPGYPNQRDLLVGSLMLTFNAIFWGLSWIPLKWFHHQGIHGLWMTAICYGLVVLSLLIYSRKPFHSLLINPGLWAMALAYGVTNSAFNWALSIGEVVRVIILFYLMPVWMVIFSRLILNQKLGVEGGVRLAFAMTGMLLVLVPETKAEPSQTSVLIDGLAILAGLCFGLANVLVRRFRAIKEIDRSFAMFIGSALIPLLTILALGLFDLSPALPFYVGELDVERTRYIWPALVGMAVGLGLANFALQVGGSRLPTQLTGLILLSEIVIASLSSMWLMQTTITLPEFIGGSIIVSAALWGLFRKT